MIIKLILNIIKWVGIVIIKVTTGTIGVDIASSLLETISDFVTIMLTFTHQALNFVYFIFGDTMFLVLPIAVTILILKYTVIPLIIIFRSFLIKGNN